MFYEELRKKVKDIELTEKHFIGVPFTGKDDEIEANWAEGDGLVCVMMIKEDKATEELQEKYRYMKYFPMHTQFSLFYHKGQKFLLGVNQLSPIKQKVKQRWGKPSSETWERIWTDFLEKIGYQLTPEGEDLKKDENDFEAVVEPGDEIVEEGIIHDNVVDPVDPVDPVEP